MEEISNSLEEFKFVYLFELENARNSLLKEVRSQWSNNSSSKYEKIEQYATLFNPEPPLICGHVHEF